jgi:hypothetical protein
MVPAGEPTTFKEDPVSQDQRQPVLHSEDGWFVLPLGPKNNDSGVVG